MAPSKTSLPPVNNLPKEIAEDIKKQKPSASNEYMGFRRNRKDGLRVMRSTDDITIRNIDTKLNQNN